MADKIQTPPASDSYRKNYDRIFKKKSPKKSK